MYRLEIANGTQSDVISFKKKMILQHAGNENRFIAEVPDFGSDYTWRVVYLSGKKELAQSELYHFSTGTITGVDTGKQRLRVLSQSTKAEGKYFFADGTKVMYDHNGVPVWYLPDVDSNNVNECDLKLTRDGTITFLKNSKAYEINYDGKILWKGIPIITEDSMVCMYHHALTKLSNGNYMSMLSSPAPIVDIENRSKPAKPERKRYFPDVHEGRIVELDKSGHIVWEWETSNYHKESDLYALTKQNDSCAVDFHENAFFLDERDSIIYLSFSGISRVIKIKYPSGAVMSTYGNLYGDGQNTGAALSNMAIQDIFHSLADNTMFKRQHSCIASKDGGLYVYNNNMQSYPQDRINKKPQVPQIVKLKEVEGRDHKASVVWTYDCIPQEELLQVSGGGGNVMELADGSLYVSTNAPYSRLALINTNKELLWSGILEVKGSGTKWNNGPCYRSSIIEKKEDLEKLIWYGRK